MPQREHEQALSAITHALAAADARIEQLEAALDAARNRADLASETADMLADSVREAEAKLATAKQDAFVDGALYAYDGAGMRDDARDEAARRYPAPSSGEGWWAWNLPRCGVCTYTHGHAEWCRPTPQAAPEPLVLSGEVPFGYIHIRITPDLARRIVALAQEGRDNG